jgi:hypothetical protein
MDQLAGIYGEAVGQMAQDGYAGGSLAAFNLTKIAAAYSGPIRKLLLRPASSVPKPAQVESKNVLEIFHGTTEAP